MECTFIRKLQSICFAFLSNSLSTISTSSTRLQSLYTLDSWINLDLESFMHVQDKNNGFKICKFHANCCALNHEAGMRGQYTLLSASPVSWFSMFAINRMKNEFIVSLATDVEISNIR